MMDGMLRCERCDHEWYPRTPKLPKCCPCCKNKYWNEKRTDFKRRSKTNIIEHATGGVE